MHWRRKRQPTPVFLPGESQGRGSLVGCRLWGHTESDTTEVTQQQQQVISSSPMALKIFSVCYLTLLEENYWPLSLICTPPQAAPISVSGATVQPVI